MNMKYGLWLIIGVVAASIVAGLFMIDSPNQVRAERFDQVRVNQLQAIQGAVLDYWNQKKVLPPTLYSLVSTTPFLVVRDPVSGYSYEYTVTGMQSFSLCGNFAVSSTPGSNMMYGYSVPAMMVGNVSMANVSWDHAAGHVCFDRHFDVVTSTPAGDVGVPKPMMIQ